MGVFSEMAIDQTNRALEGSAVEASAAALVSSIAQQRDDARQQAEEDAAKALLPQLSTEPVDAAEDPQAAKKAAEEQKRAEHERAEAKRKAEWEAKKKAKEEAEQAAWENAVAMSDDEVMTASMKRVGDDAERLTRRNMKQCVTEHIQTKCLDNADFARQVMHPRKNMVNCFRYITRKAWEYVQDKLKASGIQPGPGEQGYGCDIPDDLCYQWAEEYFMDLDAKEDKEKDEEFVPKPYYGGYTPKSKKAEKKKPEPKKQAPAAKPAAPAPKPEQNAQEQISLLDLAMSGAKAG